MEHRPPLTLLLVEDEPAHVELCRRGLSGARVHLTVAEDLASARAALAAQVPDVVLCDLRLPDGGALDLLGDDASRLALVVMTSQGDEQRAVEVMKRGALDYVVKSPEMFRELPLIVERAARAARLVADRAAAEAALRESEARFRQLAASILDVFWLYDIASDQTLYISHAWETLCGTPIAEALGPLANRLAVVAPEDRERVEATFRAEGMTSSLRQEYRLVTAGGTRRVVEERSFPVVEDGGVRRIAGLITDLTQRRALEDAVRRSQQLEALGHLAGGIAHDFNNMVGAIIFAADELARIDHGEPNRLELCEMITSAAEQTRDLTRQLLAFARKGAVATRAIDLNQLVWDTITLLRRSVDRRVTILGDLRATPAVVMGDVSQLRGALLNLGINARDAMPDGGELVFETERVVLDALSCSALPFELTPGDHVHVVVRDTGTGMSPETREHIFEPFFTTKAEGAGTGLGLAAVYGTMVAHKGAVTVYSEVGAGTVFHLYLPLADGITPAPPVPAKAPVGSGRVLVIDDEPLVTAALRRVLTSLGYSVDVAGDGATALAMFREHDRKFAAVMCDLMLPGQSGVDIIRTIREEAPQVPIVVASGFAREHTLAGLGDLAIDAFLAKPVRRAELASLLATLTSRPRQA